MTVLDGFGMHDGWAWLFGALMMLLVWGVIIWGAVYLFRRSGPDGGRDGEDDAAVRLLRERFARGEIDQEEFDTRLAALQHRGR